MAIALLNQIPITVPSTSVRFRKTRSSSRVRAEAGGAMATEKMGIKIETNPPESKLTELGVRTWPKYVNSVLVLPFYVQFQYFCESEVISNV